MGALCGQDFCGWALGDNVAVVEADDFGVEQEGFFYVVGYGEDWDAVLRGVMFHAREEGVAEGAADAGEGFVEE